MFSVLPPDEAGLKLPIDHVRSLIRCPYCDRNIVFSAPVSDSTMKEQMDQAMYHMRESYETKLREIRIAFGVDVSDARKTLYGRGKDGA